MMGLTVRQRECFDVVAAMVRDGERVTQAMDFPAPSGCKSLMHQLVDRGWLAREGQRSGGQGWVIPLRAPDGALVRFVPVISAADMVAADALSGLGYPSTASGSPPRASSGRIGRAA